MINVTSQYPTQTFLSVATSQITTQVNNINNTNIISPPFPLTYTRTSFAGVAPDGSLAKLYQVDALVNPSAVYAYPAIGQAQNQVLQAAAAQGNEYYIEISPLPALYYSVLTWTSNI